MVVAYRDQSAFAAGTPLFETILYDETDGLATGTNGLTGYWPYPKASTGKLAVWGEQHQVWSLGQHYYRVVTTL